MNIRDLRYLVTLADTLNFRHAAQLCFISQPTLSMQIKKVEEDLGTAIFERSNKQVLLTQSGREIVLAARSALEHIATMQTIATRAIDPFSGKCHLGIFPTLAPYLLPALIPKLSRQYKNLSLYLIEEKTQTLIEGTQKAQLDCAILATPFSNQEHFNVIPLFEDEFLLAVNPAHPLAKKKHISFNDIHNEALLLLDEGHCLREQALSVCQLSGANENNEFRATSLETLRQMVIANNGITLIPKIATAKKDKNIRYLPFHRNPPMRKIALIYRKSDGRHALMHAIAKTITLVTHKQTKETT